MGRKKAKDTKFQADILNLVGNLVQSTTSQYDASLASSRRYKSRETEFQKDIHDRIKDIGVTVSNIEKRKTDFQDEVFEELMNVKKLVTASNQILTRVLGEAETVAEVFIFFL